jgi:DNA-binding transcriptional ArsR family regulator
MQAGQDYGAKSPFGSAYKFNLARSVWQVERGERREEGTLDLLLRHRKANFGPLARDIGVRLTFGSDAVCLERVNPLDVVGLAEKLPAHERVWGELSHLEQATAEELAEATGLPEKTARNALTALRKAGRAVTESGRWRAIPNSHPIIERESGIVSEPPACPHRPPGQKEGSGHLVRLALDMGATLRTEVGDGPHC